MLLHIVAGLSCFIGALLQYAVLRRMSNKSPPIECSACRIVMVAMLVGGIYIFGSLWTDPDSLSPLVSLLVGLHSMGQMLFAFHHLEFHLPYSRQKQETA